MQLVGSLCANSSASICRNPEDSEQFKITIFFFLFIARLRLGSQTHLSSVDFNSSHMPKIVGIQVSNQNMPKNIPKCMTKKTDVIPRRPYARTRLCWLRYDFCLRGTGGRWVPTHICPSYFSTNLIIFLNHFDHISQRISSYFSSNLIIFSTNLIILLNQFFYHLICKTIKLVKDCV